jgi:hypothetical protein
LKHPLDGVGVDEGSAGFNELTEVVLPESGGSEAKASIPEMQSGDARAE